MFKSIYGYLFNKKDHAQEYAPTIDQIFAGADIRNPPNNPPPVLIADRPVQHQQPSAPPAPVNDGTKQAQHSQPLQPLQLVWSSTEKRWVEHIPAVVAQVALDIQPGTEVLSANVVNEEVIQVHVVTQTPPVISAEVKNDDVNSGILPNNQELTLVKPITDLKGFRETAMDHIAAQRQKHEERLRQEQLARLEKPKKELKRWIPIDHLVEAHDKASEVVGKVPNLLKKVKQHKDKIAGKQAEVDKILNKKELNPYDRFEIIDYKKDIAEEEGKIAAIELELEHAQRYIDNPIFEEFALYMSEAEQYIKDAELTGIMTANDILTSNSIYLKTKSLMDSLKYGKKNPVLMERLERISELFNMGEVHENSRGKNLRQFGNFFIGDKSKDPLYLFDRMDIQAIGDSSTMRTIACGKEGGMINQNMIIDVPKQTEKHVEQINDGMITETTLYTSQVGEGTDLVGGGIDLCTKGGKY